MTFVNKILEWVRFLLWTILVLWILSGGLCRTAQAQTIAELTTIVACQNPQESDAEAQRARSAARAGNHAEAGAAWRRAIVRCPSPDLFEGLGRSSEGLAATALDERDRLRALEEALAAYRETTRRLEMSPLQGYSPEGVRARATTIAIVVSALQARLAPPILPPTLRPPSAVAVDSHVDPRPAIVPPPPRPSRALPFALLTSGIGLTLTGGALLGIGLAAQSAADADAGVLHTRGCDVNTIAPTCLAYPAGQTTPEEVANWAVPTGAVVLGVGVVDTLIGAILLARRGRTVERPHVGATVTAGQVGLTFNSSF